LRHRLIWQNPHYLNALKWGSRCLDIPPYLFAVWQDGEELVLARGFIRGLIALCHKHRIPFVIEDATRALPPVDFNFSGSLYGYQAEALRELSKRRFAILAGPTGCGKRITALRLIAERRQPALIVVATLRQAAIWKAIIRRFLDIDDSGVGFIGGGQMRFGDKITVAVVPSIYRVAEEMTQYAGFLIVEGADKVNLNVLRKVVLPFAGPFMLGLAVNPKRTDGLTGLTCSYLGEVAYEIHLPGKFAGIGAARPRLIVRRTDFQYALYAGNFAAMIKALCMNEARNALIVADILQETVDPRVTALILSERAAHLEVLRKEVINAQGRDGYILAGSNEKERRLILENIKKKPSLIYTTFAAIRGGDLDAGLPGLTKLFLASPLKNADVVSHAVGAILATDGKFLGDDGEGAAVYDYQDTNIPVLNISFAKRKKYLFNMGVVVAENRRS